MASNDSAFIHGDTMDTSPCLTVLHRVFGYAAFRGLQAEIVEHVAAGGDCFVSMSTGSGKSLCYQIPALVRSAAGLGPGIIVSPLIALMQDQVTSLTALGVRAAYLNSSLSAQAAQEIERAFLKGQIDLLYVAPERLMTSRFLDLIERTKVGLFAIDEAHCVSQWGHDFRPEYIQLSVLHERYPDVPRIALTATADPQTRAEIIARLGFEDSRVFISSFDRPNIRYRIVEKDNARAQLLKFLRAEHSQGDICDAGIIYCLSRRKVEETAAWLNTEGLHALTYHGGMDTETRQTHQQRFQREEGIVMVATIAFGMGIDKPDVRFVAHLDMPKSMEGYYQETGRAGRDGLPANAWMAYGLGDVVQQRKMIEESGADDARKRLSTIKLDALLGFCETVSCRRVQLLNYFGEASQPCGNCDTCLEPPILCDRTREAQMALSCVYRVRHASGYNFGAGHLIDVLRGKLTDRIQQRGHQNLSTFGVGVDASEMEWRTLFRQLVATGLLTVDADGHGALVLTQASRAVLKGEQNVMVRHYVKPARSQRPATRNSNWRAELTADMSAEQLACWERLRTWRTEKAKLDGVPAYVIFHDSTLMELACAEIDSVQAIRAVSGVGARKFERFGEELLQVIEANADVLASGSIE